MDGRWLTFDEEGHVMGDGTWVDGEREGRWVWTDANGSGVEQYRNGKQEGRFERRFVDGTLAEEGAYVLGEKVGCWRRWHANGALDNAGWTDTVADKLARDTTWSHDRLGRVLATSFRGLTASRAS